MKRKLGRLLRPGMGVYFGVMALFCATALLAEDGGFALIGKTLRECGTYLSGEEAFLWLEMGENHGERALECVRKYNFFQSAELLPDQYGVKRFLFARRHKG